MNKISEGFNTTFENGGFWEYYKDLERQFENFLEYVPYLDGNEKTYSFRLLNIFLSIGGYIDSAFKEMARCPELIEEDLCKEILKRSNDRLGIIVSGIRAFDEIYNITSKSVIFKSSKRTQITPFNQSKPEWWNFYNDLKHDVSISLKKANLQNVRDALAGAFLLNVIHAPSSRRLFKYGLIKPKYPPEHKWENTDSINAESICSQEHPTVKFHGPFLVETSIFIHDYQESGFLGPKRKNKQGNN